MEREDIEILKDINENKEQAIDELIKKYQKKVYNLIYGLCLNYDIAWDVSQEVFIKVIKNVKNFRQESSFWTYLYRISMNAYYDYYRKMKVRSKEFNFTDMEDEETKRSYQMKDLFDIQEDFEKKELKENIKLALKGLTDMQKQVFILKNSQGLKIKEIAEILQISEGTVKSHLNRTMEKLKETLGAKL